MNQPTSQTELIHFVILMPWGRVGSNLLTNILQQSKKLKLANEPMTGIRSRNREANDQEIAKLQKEWFDEFYGELTEKGKSGGAKLSMSSVCDRETFVAGLLERKLRMIYMDRRNLVKTAISVLKAEVYAEKHKEKFGKASWAVRPGREMKEKTHIDIAIFEERLKLCQLNQKLMRELSVEVPGLDIYYEDIMFDIDGVITETLEFLGVEPFEYEIPFVKAVSDDLREEIENFDEVLNCLTTDEHRAMLME